LGRVRDAKLLRAPEYCQNHTAARFEPDFINLLHRKTRIRVEEATIMSRVCQVTGKRPVTGNNVSHAKNRTRRRFLPNLHSHRFWVEAEKRFVTLRVSSKGMRIIDKKGIESVLAELTARGEKF
tara:strand:- start:747 stop:1118 length:372 start_codon:yes stop_codon:yes gene_type:complete